MNKTEIKAKPVFKYIGGKRWLAKDLQHHINQILNLNKSINKYCEPFAGGLGAFLSVAPVLKLHDIKKVLLNDINKPIINFYSLVQKDYSELFDDYLEIENDFLSVIPNKAKDLHRTKDKEQLKMLLEDANLFFKDMRKNFNEEILSKKEEDLGVKNASLFLFLQKHSFNGIYRENKKGEYNTPFNWEVGSVDFNRVKDDFSSLSYLFKQFDLTFSCKNYNCLNKSDNILFYLDPPYLNENKAENNYNKNAFGLSDQKALIEYIKDTSFLYSNNNSQLLLDIFNKKIINGFNTFCVERANIISSSSKTRNKKQQEMLVRKVFS